MGIKFSKFVFVFRALIVVLSLMPRFQLGAQDLTNFYSFTSFTGADDTNSDGANPQADLVLYKNIIYGTARNGGSSGNGTVFAVNIDGTGFANLHSFSVTSGNGYTNYDGANPCAGLLLSSNILYGTTQRGGTFGCGTVFAIQINGSKFRNLYSFTGGADGAYPQSALVLSGNSLYGTAPNGSGGSIAGTVFKINTDGTDFTNLYGFTGGDDGGNPQAGLCQSSNTLYGTTVNNGWSGYGTIFAIGTDGSSFTNWGIGDGVGGAYPIGGLILSSNILYGTTTAFASGYGGVFAVATDGSNFTGLYSFTGGEDGSYPLGKLLLLGNTLYGTTDFDGSSGIGTIFSITIDGTAYNSLYSFSGANGANPLAGLIEFGNELYGTASQGGASGNGVLFSLTLPSLAPTLNIISTSTNVIITWPNTTLGYSLQSTTNLAVPVWINESGKFFVTNSIVGTAKYYRLSK
jgi:uncharacterized repeat protein (TIGR03803 family)